MPRSPGVTRLGLTVLGVLTGAAATFVLTAPVVSGPAGAATLSATSGTSGSDPTPASLSGIKDKAAADIAARLDALNTGIARLSAATDLGSGKATLDTYLVADVAPLQQLGQKIADDTTAPQAAQDFADIFRDYRVYALVLPAAHLAADVDRMTATTIPALATDEARAQTRVTPTNQGLLQPLLTDLGTQIATATTDTNGLATTVLAFTPSQWNADQGLLAATSSSEENAAAALSRGRSDLQQIAQDLRSAC